MDFNEWEGWYKEILETLGFLRDDDEKTAELLDKILDEKGCLTIEQFFDEMMGKKDTSKFIVVGAGPSIKKHIKYVKENYDLNDYLIVSADGATTAMLEDDLVPDIVATDLDGKMEDLLAANSLGSYFVIHAHGDNEELIMKWTTSFDKILGTLYGDIIRDWFKFEAFNNTTPKTDKLNAAWLKLKEIDRDKTIELSNRILNPMYNYLAKSWSQTVNNINYMRRS